MQQLTKLYERAKFSRHEIDEGMKDDAIDALVGLRAELEPEARGRRREAALRRPGSSWR